MFKYYLIKLPFEGDSSPVALYYFSDFYIYSIYCIIDLVADTVICALSNPRCIDPPKVNTLSSLSYGNYTFFFL